MAGRGGSVSRRDHNPVYRRSVTLAGARKLERRTELIPQLLFGRRGLGERRFSQRSGLSPRVSVFSPSHLRPCVGADALALGTGEVAEAGVKVSVG